MTTTELRVFISSTFRDLQEEREHLVKKIFPEIRALCRARGVTFTDIDLRWGITEEQAEKEGIINICLDEIDRCRPYFIGILGERYGWTPPRSDSERITDRFPVLGSRLLDGASITEMEIVHGVLANPSMAGHAFFYFRDHDATPTEFVDTHPDTSRRLRDLKARILQSGFPVRENFTTATELGDWLEEDLRRVIDIEHPESETPSALELERRAHRAFAASRTRAYVANPEYDRQFNEWLKAEGRGMRAEGRGMRAEGRGMRAEGRGMRAEGRGMRAEGRGTETDPPSLVPKPSPITQQPSPLAPQPSSLVPQPSPLVPQPSPLIPEPSTLNPLFITADSGLGKSSLVAHLVEEYRAEHPTAFIIEHYVGSSLASGTATAIVRQIIDEIRERFGISDEAATKPDELERSFPNWLYRGEHFAKQSGADMLIVIDAVNQLDESGRRLAWLPTVIPSGIKLLVSTIPGPCTDELAKREWARLDVSPIEDEHVRRAIVLHYLGEFHKGISADQVARVTADAKASSPLFLRVVAEELRLHGEHETLDAAIDRFANAADLLDVFDRVLERLERDHGEATVRDVTSVIWASRSGLSEEELMALAGLNRLELSRLLFALDFHLVQRGDVLGFFHDYLRSAVERRYLAEPHVRRGRSRQLAAFFEQAEITIRSTLELFHALESLGDRKRLEHAAAEMRRFVLLWSGAEQDEILRVWSGCDAAVVVAACQAALSEWLAIESPDQVRHAGGLDLVGALLETIGASTDAESVVRESVVLARAAGDRTVELRALIKLSLLARRLGRMDEAELVARDAEAIAREAGDREGVANAVGFRGTVHSSRGEYDDALACYAEQESIARELGDRQGIGIAVGNRGVVHKSRGEYEQAEACYAEWESIARAMGDRRNVGLAVSNRGNVHYDRGQYDEALACHTECESIGRALGDRQSIDIAVGNRGMIHAMRGEIDEAIACFTEQESVARAMGDRRHIGIAVGNRGFMYRDRGNYEVALAHFEEALDEHRKIGFHFGVTYWLEGSARALLELAALEIDPPPSIVHFVPEAVGAGWKQACLATARVHAEECLAISRELQKPDTLHTSRVLLARIDAAEGRTDVAFEQLRSMVGGATDDDDRADLHYWFWKLAADTPTAAEHAAAALALYEALCAKTPKYEYKKRIEELAG